MSLEDFLSRHTDSLSVPAGTEIVAEGTQAQAAYFIREGFARVFRVREGRESVVSRLGPGSIFGEMALLRYDTYTLSVRAETDLSLYVIPAALMAEALRQTPPLVRAIVDLLIDRVNETNEALMDLDLRGPG